MSITLFGIKNCDSVKKARKFLDQAGTEYQFHDYREQGISREVLDSWLQHQPWTTLLNKRSTSFRQLSEADKAVDNTEHARDLMLANPTLIKRPVVVCEQTVLVGFKASEFEQLLIK